VSQAFEHKLSAMHSLFTQKHNTLLQLLAEPADSLHDWSWLFKQE
jgi:hypothetical protein